MRQHRQQLRHRPWFISACQLLKNLAPPLASGNFKNNLQQPVVLKSTRFHALIRMETLTRRYHADVMVISMLCSVAHSDNTTIHRMAGVLWCSFGLFKTFCDSTIMDPC